MTDPPLALAGAPELVRLDDGARIDLRMLAALADTGDDQWPEHLTRYLLAWALEDARAGLLDCVEQVSWLARALTARHMTARRVADRVELAAACLAATSSDPVASLASARLRDAARTVAPRR